MPYIVQQKRDEITLGMAVPQTAGELNFVITSICIEYLRHKGKSYQTINDVSGAMTESLAEFRRRVTVDYEMDAIKRNGDIF